MSGFIALYFVGVVVTVAFSLIVYMWEGREKTRKGARIILLSPVWPLIFPVGAARIIRWLWKKADWKGIEEEEATLREQRMGRARGW